MGQWGYDGYDGYEGCQAPVETRVRFCEKNKISHAAARPKVLVGDDGVFSSLQARALSLHFS